MLLRLIYSSHATPATGADDIDAILNSARRLNAEHEITGLLCYGGRRFIQYIEGQRGDIDLLFERLRQDSRHENFQLLDYEAITARRYPDWSMGYVSMEDKMVQNALRRETGLAGYQTEDLSKQQAIKLLDTLKSVIDPHLIVAPRAQNASA